MATTEASIPELEAIARRLRIDVIRMTTRAGSGHPSTSMSCMDLVVALYSGGVLRHDSQRPDWPERDRFIMSKGHGCPAQYAVMAERGYFDRSALDSLRQLGSPLEGHPNVLRLPGIEASTGSLGQGLSIGLGMALAARLDGKDFNVFVLIGDGENDEGQIWEAALAGAKYDAANLTCIVDANTAQQTGYTKDVMPTESLVDKWRSFGWETQEIDGHDMAATLNALQTARAATSKPQCIIARTLKGKGVGFVEASYGYHGKALTEEEAERAIAELSA